MVAFTILSPYNTTAVMMKNTNVQSEFHTILQHYSTEWESLIEKFCRPIGPIPTAVAAELTPIPNIRAVLFDIYGTLLISGSGEVGSASDKKKAAKIEAGDQGTDLLFYKAFHEAGITIKKSAHMFNDVCTNLYTSFIQSTHSDLMQRGIEYPEVDILEIWRSMWETLNKQQLINEPISAYKIVRLAFIYELIANPTWPMPNVLNTLTTLSNHGNVLGIVSNAQFYTPYILSVLFGKPLGTIGFDQQALVWSYKLGQSKPSPLLFTPVLDYLKMQYGINADEILYVGNDMLNDIHTASAAGCKTALFAGDQRSLRLRKGNSLVQSDRADAIITDILQLKHILELKN